MRPDPDTGGAEGAEGPDPGSFRDPQARVFYHAGEVYRGLSPEALRAWERLVSTRFFPRLIAAGRIVATEQVDHAAGPGPAARDWAGVLRHARIPFVSYPYEWPFGMLREAALLHIEVLLDALDENITVKDGSPFNVQWVGTRPVFIDVSSFEPLLPGEPWLGYRQFCQSFLYPLMLQAYRGVPFHPWLRGSLEGITASDCRRLMSWRDLVRPGVFAHVFLHGALQAACAGTTGDFRSDLRAAGFDSSSVVANVRRLARAVRALEWAPAEGGWSDYESSHGYDEADHAAKLAFVSEVAGSRHWGVVWDLGCNTGAFARVAARHADYVVAMDADHGVIERLYRRLRADVNSTVLPLVMNLADPSPGLGWRGQERKGLTARGTPELTLCLALVHHLVFGASLPLSQLLDWLASLGTALVIEFITADDPVVTRMKATRRSTHASDYDLPSFERGLNRSWRIARRQPLPSGTRVLYHATPRWA